MVLQPPTVFHNASFNRSSSQRTADHEIPAISPVDPSAFEVTAGSAPIAPAQATSKSTLSPAVIPVSWPGILEGREANT